MNRLFHFLGTALICLLLPFSGRAASLAILHDFQTLSNSTGFNPTSTLVQDTAGTLYGTCSAGIFRVQTNGTGFALFPTFTNGGPQVLGDLTISSNVLYGVAMNDFYTQETLFRVNTDGSGYLTLHEFAPLSSGTNAEGYSPSPLLAVGNTLYGTAGSGGPSGSGTVFKINTDGTGFAVLHTFTPTALSSSYLYTNADGAYPACQMAISGGRLFGSTSQGGVGYGTLFQMDTTGSNFASFYFVNGIGPNGPNGPLLLSGNTIYLTENYLLKINIDSKGYVASSLTNNALSPIGNSRLAVSGARVFASSPANLDRYDPGAILSFPTNLGFAPVVHAFAHPESADPGNAPNPSPEGYDPQAGLLLTGNTLYGATAQGSPYGYGGLFSVQTNGTGFTNFFNFQSVAGSSPLGLTRLGNFLFGVTLAGGTGSAGTIFRVNADGTGFTNLYDFSLQYPDIDATNLDGASPLEFLAADGNQLYGVTQRGGTNGVGTVFKINSDGTGFTVLYTFDSSSSIGGCAVIADHTLYGGARGGVFKMNEDGSDYTILTNGDQTTAQGRLLVTNGVIYGTSYGVFLGDDDYPGSEIFSMNTGGSGFTVLHVFAPYGYGGAFTNADGIQPNGSLIISSNMLYGTASSGGPYGYGTLFKLNTGDSGFTVLHSFDANSGNVSPYLVLRGDTIYGTTGFGQNNVAGSPVAFGSAFKIKTDGTGYCVLHTFNGADGSSPIAGALSGNSLIGVTQYGGQLNAGVVFSLDLTPSLSIAAQSNSVVLTWGDSTWSLQAAPAVTGVFTNVPSATSPWTNAITDPAKFFRLNQSN